ncbi:hypothetical protein J7426_10725 [Tropicibacter sp. R16_0]|uniref:hypothetical protein n=1 Tax=Tropicibacter sp. R16_0 TaxID=2821102 RepID=UPI001ADB6697|nr:hypothetical protein [Tropicibacter sp. R16_0]MBO9450734.1 hypothetical protein [Tropicibacter sp. R16_0]
MPFPRHFLLLVIALLVSGTSAQAQQDHALTVDSLSVLRDGRVLVRYDLKNTQDRPVCLPAQGGAPQVFVEQFSATDNLPMVRSDAGVTGVERFRSPYLWLEPGQGVSSSVIYSAHEFSGFGQGEGQLARPPRVERDPLFVILSVPLRNCPLFRHNGNLTFNGTWHVTRVVRSLPSRVFSLARPGRY